MRVLTQITSIEMAMELKNGNEIVDLNFCDSSNHKLFNCRAKAENFLNLITNLKRLKPLKFHSKSNIYWI